MSEGTPQPLGTIKSEKRVNPQISRRECNRYGQGVGWVAQQQYPLRLDQASSTEPTRSCINMTKASSGWPSRGSRTPPTDLGMARARTCRAMHKPLQRNLARYRELGNGVIGSTAQAFPRPSADHARGIRYRS
ncbi:hypothetical protein V6N13_000040 [Hibiscus sabdariffa]